MTLYYRMDGTPYPEGQEGLEQWAKDLSDTGARRIGITDLPNGLHISTVWLGLDHNFFGTRPLIFETMVFFKGRSSDIDCWRYSTLEEARLGHKMMVKKYSTMKTIQDILK